MTSLGRGGLVWGFGVGTGAEKAVFVGFSVWFELTIEPN